MKRIKNLRTYLFWSLFILMDLFVKISDAQVYCSPFQTPPPNNPDGSGDVWYPYKTSDGTSITIFGHPSNQNQNIVFSLSLNARQWKLNYLHVQRYNIFYLGTNEGPDFSLPIDENTKTDQGNQINLILYCDLRTCHAFGNHQCSLDRPNSPYGSININVEVPDWDRNQWVKQICQGEKPFDISTFLINSLLAKPGNKIQNVNFFVDGKPISGTLFDPSLYAPGDHIITASKTYCNSSSDWGQNGDFQSLPYSITVTAPEIQFPITSLFLCSNSSPYFLLASPTGGIWSDITNSNNPAINGNIFDPSKTSAGNYTLRYTYTDPNTGCIGKKDLPIVINQAPEIKTAIDTSVLFQSNPFTLKGDYPLNGTYSGQGITGNIFNPGSASLCTNLINYTVINPLTQCSSTSTRKITIIPIIGPDFKICNNAPSYDLLQDVNPKGGVFSGQGVEGNNFNPTSLSPGDYTITYSISNLSGCIAENKRIVSVLRSPQAPLINGLLSGCNGTEITLQASSPNSENDTFQWYKVNETSPFYSGNSLIYTINGSEKIIVKSSNELGCVSNPGSTVSIISFNPNGDFNADLTQVPFGGLVNFTSSISGITYNWDFGDGGTAIKANPFHYYYSSGFFDVKLTVTSSEGCSTIIQKKHYINVLPENSQAINIIQTDGNGFDPSLAGFNIYPSPFKDFIKINCNLINNQDVKVELFDLIGHLKAHQILNGKTGLNNLILNNLNYLESGVFYLIKVSSNEFNQMEKILKL